MIKEFEIPYSIKKTEYHNLLNKTKFLVVKMENIYEIERKFGLTDKKTWKEYKTRVVNIDYYICSACKKEYNNIYFVHIGSKRSQELINRFYKGSVGAWNGVCSLECANMFILQNI